MNEEPYELPYVDPEFLRHYWDPPFEETFGREERGHDTPPSSWVEDPILPVNSEQRIRRWDTLIVEIGNVNTIAKYALHHRTQVQGVTDVQEVP